MNGRQRVLNALNFKPVDKFPLEYHPSFCGLYEHGEKYRALVKNMPGDFEDYSNFPTPIPAGKFSADGGYDELRTDEWGVVWHHKIFGIMGHPISWPLDDISKLKDFKIPQNIYTSNESFAKLKDDVNKTHAAGLFHKAGGNGFLERMIAMRRFEDVLMDIAEDTAEINQLADMITDYCIRDIEMEIKSGADAISFGDDFGTQANMLVSPDVWRSFFAPRLARMVAPVKAAGLKALMHSCGQITPILEDLKRLGFDSIWPQQSLYNPYELASHCRELGLAVCIHIDRAHVMTKGTPEDVKKAVETAFDAYKPLDGGSWLYIEVDNGFPFENIEALFKSAAAYR